MVLVAAAVWSGCSEEREVIAVPDGALEGDLILEPCVYEARDIEYSAECGLLVVPENRTDADSRLIALPVTKVLATGEDVLEPIFYLAGGPGNSNMHFSRLQGLIDRHDIVMVGYRGVDGSVALHCPEVGTVFGELPDDLLSRAAAEAIGAGYAACAARLANEGVDTDGYTVLEVVDDIETARTALEYARINLLSQSYGTRLAMIHTWRYPESVHRSAMISVNPPGHFVWFADIVDEQIRSYSDLCQQDLACSGRTEDLAAAMFRVSHDMPESWLFFPIKKGNVLAATFIMLYHTTTAPKVFDAWIAADEGDASGLAVLSLMIDLMLSKIPFLGDSAAKATSVDYQLEPGDDYLQATLPADSIIGSSASILGWAAALGWPVHAIPEEYRQVQPSETETLMVSGSIDFSTPAQTATKKLLPRLGQGRQVILREFGHTGDVWNLQPPATIRLLTSFFDTGKADDSLYEPNEVNFGVRLGYPGMIKLGLTAAGLVALALGGLIAYLVRRRRRRRLYRSTGNS